MSLLILAPSVAISADGWQSYMHMTSNYFEGLGENHRIVLTMETPFHTCGWNSAAHVNLNVVGPETFKTYTSVILAAWLANKKISINTNGCIGDRSKIIAVRIAK